MPGLFPLRLSAFAPIVALAMLSSSPSANGSEVRRAEAMATAETYLHLKWRPTSANAFHGKDASGIPVETPDEGFRRPGIRPGWWKAGVQNEGMPYMWGGFSSPSEFLAGIRAGRAAGDVYTLEKRAQGDAAVSRQAVGIDCSGLISRCWRLPRAYSTEELPSLCVRLNSYEELKSGDILNSPKNHVLMFKAFADAAHTRILEYEAGSPPTWKVLLNSVPVSLLKEQGFVAWRYRGMRD